MTASAEEFFTELQQQIYLQEEVVPGQAQGNSTFEARLKAERFSKEFNRER